MLFKDRYRKPLNLFFPFSGSSQPYSLALGQSTLFFAASIFFLKTYLLPTSSPALAEATESTLLPGICQYLFCHMLKKICFLPALLSSLAKGT